MSSTLIKKYFDQLILTCKFHLPKATQIPPLRTVQKNETFDGRRYAASHQASPLTGTKNMQVHFIVK